MVTVTIKDGKFVIHGSFDFGYMGIYHDDEIIILRTPAEVRKWKTASAALDTKTCSDDDIAAFLTAHLNAWEEKVRLNKKRINDNFLVRIFEDLEACAYPFWETEGLYVPEQMPEDPESLYDGHEDEMSVLEDAFNSSPNDGSIEKPDAEAALRRMYPMFRFDAFLASLKPDCMSLSDGRITFQCTDGFGAAVACGAYDALDSDLVFNDWHNF